MGALILLLLVTTRRMHKDQQQATKLAENAWASGDSPVTFEPPPADAFVLALGETRAIPSADDQQEFSTALLPTATTNLAADAEAENASIAEQRQRIAELELQIEAERERRLRVIQQIDVAKTALHDADDEAEEYLSQMQQLDLLVQQEHELTATLLEKEQVLANLRVENAASEELAAKADEVLQTRESALVSLLKVAQESEGSATTATSQTVIEFSGATGTSRIPILVDLTADGFTFLPSGVRVPVYDADHFPQRFDPLISVAMAIHKARSAQSPGKQPYVSLLVRPDAAKLFLKAKLSLRRANVHFGYELLEQETQVAAGRRDPREVSVAEAAYANSYRRRHPNYESIAQLKKSLEMQMNDSQGTTRNLSIPGFNERVYAGQHAPGIASAPRYTAKAKTPPSPPPFDQRRNSGGGGSTTTGNEALLPLGVTGNVQDSTNPFASLSGINKPVEGRTAETTSGSPFEDQFGQPELTVGAPLSAKQQVEADTFAGDFAGPFNDSMPETLASELASGTGEGHERTTADTRSMLPTRRTLSENLGVGARRSTAATATNPSPDKPSISSDKDTLNRTDPQEPTRWPDSLTAIHESGSRPAGPAQDLSKNAAADSNAGANPFAESSSQQFGQQTEQNGRRTAASPPSFLQQFMMKVEEQRQINSRLPDPMLVSMLQAARDKQERETLSPSPSPNSETDAKSDIAANAADLFESFKDATEPTGEVASVKTDGKDNPFAELVAEAEDTAGAAEDSNVVSAAPPVQKFQSFPLGDREDSANNTAASSSASSSVQTVDAQPTPKAVGPNEVVYWVIKIHTQNDELMVGDFEPIETKGWTNEQRLAVTLEAVSATMQEVWSDIRKDAVPAVRFLVPQGADDVQRSLSKSLADINVPTRGVFRESVKLTRDRFYSDASPNSYRDCAIPARSQRPPVQKPPAEPVSTTPPTDRRTSI